MENKEFDLSEKRINLYYLFKCEEYQAVSLKILQEVEKQDKEFIKRLKEGPDKDTELTIKELHKFIDKLAGKEFT